MIGPVGYSGPVLVRALAEHARLVRLTHQVRRHQVVDPRPRSPGLDEVEVQPVGVVPEVGAREGAGRVVGHELLRPTIADALRVRVPDVFVPGGQTVAAVHPEEVLPVLEPRAEVEADVVCDLRVDDPLLDDVVAPDADDEQRDPLLLGVLEQHVAVIEVGVVELAGVVGPGRVAVLVRVGTQILVLEVLPVLLIGLHRPGEDGLDDVEALLRPGRDVVLGLGLGVGAQQRPGGVAHPEERRARRILEMNAILGNCERKLRRHALSLHAQHASIN